MTTSRIHTPMAFFMIALSACVTEGGDGEKGAPKLDYKKHTDTKVLSALEVQLRGDTTKPDTTYDLYFDLSSTMSRAVKDKVYADLITQAINESDANTNCYSIGASPALKPVTGDNATRRNTYLNIRSYTEMLTYMTPNLDNIAAHPQRPAVMFTDFSVDEKKPTTDMNGVTSAFVRGPEFKGQFARWFNAGGTVRIYGKRTSEGGMDMPIYVIAFLPAGLNADHKVNNTLKDLDDKLRDIYYDLHPDLTSISTDPNGKQLSDHLGFSQSAGGKTLENGMGEVLIYEGDALMAKVKKDPKQSKISFFGGLSYLVDSTSYLAEPEFDLVVNEYMPASKTELSKDLGKALDLWSGITVGQDQALQIPLNIDKANKPNNYREPRFLRVTITAKGTARNFNEDRAKGDLAYSLPSGRKPLLNDCLFESLSKGLDEAVRNARPSTIYTICAFIKPSK